MFKAKPKKTMKQQMNYYAKLGKAKSFLGGAFRYQGKSHSNLQNPPKKRSLNKKKFHRQRK